ncbi:LLM class flavin-dependent oxidoreductase [Pseudonocardia petroleophila]
MGVPLPLRTLGFLTVGSFDGADPRAGHESTLEVIELGERLGFDGAWLRHRHLQYGISSPVAVMAAATRRTSRIELGTAVTPLGRENPLRLAEDLTYERVTRLVALIRGEVASPFSGTVGIEEFSDRVQPHSPGPADRIWFGAASPGSARWAGEQGLSLLTSSVLKAPTPDDTDFAALQAAQIATFRAAHPAGDRARVSQGLVVIPTDTATAEQRARYAAYVEARTPRTARPRGPANMLFAPDVLGSSAQIAETLIAHAGFRAVDEVVFALPFGFEHADHVQILTDMATRLGPALGWSPRLRRRGTVAAQRRCRRRDRRARPAGPRPPGPRDGPVGRDRCYLISSVNRRRRATTSRATSTSSRCSTNAWARIRARASTEPTPS